MDLMDKVNDIARMVGDKANELIEVGKLNLKMNQENAAVESLQKQIGEIAFGKFRSGDELDPEIEELCIKIEKHKRTMAETQRELNRKKVSADDPIDMAAMGYCPYCGASLAKNAAFCSQCGQKVK